MKQKISRKVITKILRKIESLNSQITIKEAE